MKLIFLGAPGVGKGTYASRVGPHFGIPQVSTGDLVRTEIKAGTPLGQRMKQVVDAGGLVDDATITEMLKNRLAQPDAEKGFTEADQQSPVRRGAYLVTIGHCMECHTPAKDGKTLYEQALGKGGKPFGPGLVKGYPADWSGSVSRNITSHPEAGIGRWTDAEIKRAITQGISRDGHQLKPPMGFLWYAGLKEADLDAIVAWLRTLPALE